MTEVKMGCPTCAAAPDESCTTSKGAIRKDHVARRTVLEQANPPKAQHTAKELVGSKVRITGGTYVGGVGLAISSTTFGGTSEYIKVMQVKPKKRNITVVIDHLEKVED